MSVHFEKIPIKDIHQETGNCISLSFNIPQHLHTAFQYKPGQHLTLRAFINGAEVRRSYSLCSSPLEGEWRIAIKKAEEGLFSTHAHEHLKPGDIIELMPPAGNFFTPLNAGNKKHYVAFAAGSGITPVFSLIKTILQTEPRSSVTLVYGNRDRKSIIFLEALEALKNIYMQRFNLIHILSREATEAKINSGRIDEEKCELLFNKIIPAPADEFFICGPQEMIFTIKKFLLKKNIEEKKIHFELFNTADSKAASNMFWKKKITPEKKTFIITIKLDGIVFNIEMDNEESILDAAINEGYDLPYSCKGGMCCTCKAKLLEGNVQMDVHYGLDEEEIAAGYILTCQSHPLTPKVSISFDAE